jgi:hypothetical protein
VSVTQLDPLAAVALSMSPVVVINLHKNLVVAAVVETAPKRSLFYSLSLFFFPL